MARPAGITEKPQPELPGGITAEKKRRVAMRPLDAGRHIACVKEQVGCCRNNLERKFYGID